MPEELAPHPRRLADVIRRQAWIVLGSVALAVAVALLVVTLATPTYRASMKLVVGQAGASTQPPIDSLNLTQTMTQLVESDVVASGVITRLNLHTTPQALDRKLHVIVEPNSSAIEVTFDAPNAQQAQRTLAAFAAVLKRHVDDKLGFGRNTGSLIGRTSQPVLFATVFDPPHVDPSPVSPRKARTVAVAGVLGLVVGLLLAFARERLDSRLRSRAEAEDAFGAPVIGGLGHGWQSAPRALPSRRSGGDAGLDDAVQALALNLDLLHSTNGHGARRRAPMIAVTSAGHGEGKTSVVATISVALAQGGHDVICVEADGHEQGLRSHLNIAAAHGYAPATETTYGSAPTVTAGADEHLLDVDVGVAGAGRLRLLTADGWSEAVRPRRRLEDDGPLLSDLVLDADYVIFDAAPLAVGEGSRVAAMADDVVVVARMGHTTRGGAEDARRTLERLGVRQVAVVLTDADRDGR